MCHVNVNCQKVRGKAISIFIFIFVLPPLIALIVQRDYPYPKPCHYFLQGIQMVLSKAPHRNPEQEIVIGTLKHHTNGRGGGNFVYTIGHSFIQLCLGSKNSLALSSLKSTVGGNRARRALGHHYFIIDINQPHYLYVN